MKDWNFTAKVVKFNSFSYKHLGQRINFDVVELLDIFGLTIDEIWIKEYINLFRKV